MHYLGGKARIGKKLSEYINKRIKPAQPYWEPFVGSGWVISRIDNNRLRYASDIHKELIDMWIALQGGWIPPQNITEEDYYEIKHSSEDNRLRAFAGFGCSWGGKWWGGYARDGTERNYAKNAHNSLMKKTPFVKQVNFFHSDYRDFTPPDNSFIYCDPPYANTTEFKDKFDSEEFFQWVREMTLVGHTVLVSEYVSPPDFTCVWSQQTKTDMRVNNKKEPRTEKLFEYIKGDN